MKPKPGDKLQHKEFNLRSHFGPCAKCISVKGDSIVVERIIGGKSVKGEWLLGDWQPYGYHGSDGFDSSRTEPKNDCLGLSWSQIETMQGGRLR